MSDTWNSFLAEHQPLLAWPQLENKLSIMPLTGMSMLEINGDDASGFLQNLLTNDVDALQVNQSQLSGFCNAKGRLFAIFLLIKRSNNYQILLPTQMISSLVLRLSMYILRSKVQINNVTSHYVLLGLHHLARPINNDASETHYLLHPADNTRTICITTTDMAVKIATDLLAKKWQLTSENYWQLLDIQAGLPMIFPETKESFTPQQVNFDLVGGVSFSKGCYPGQEVVARLHYLGTPSRRLFSANAESTKLPKQGNEVLLDDGTHAGDIVMTQNLTSDGIKLLISLKISAHDKPLFLGNNTPLDNVTNLADTSP